MRVNRDKLNKLAHTVADALAEIPECDFLEDRNTIRLEVRKILEALLMQEARIDQAFGDARFNHLQVTGGDHFGVDEVLDRAAGQIANVIARKNHGCRAQDSASGPGVYTLALESNIF